MRQAVKRVPSVIRHSDILDGRPGFRLQAEWGYVSVLEGGGHICELVSHKHGDAQSSMEANVEDHRPVHVHTRQAHPSLWTAA